MLKIKHIYIIVGLLFVFNFADLFLQKVQGQQLPIYTQYKLNGHVLNPAISGAYGFTTINLTTREQWLGFKGSPNTYTLSGEWRLLKRGAGVSSGLLGIKRLQKSREGRVGLGGVVFRDNNGHVSRTGAKFSYAYHIKLYSSQLSFGVGLSAFQFKVNTDDLVFPEDDTRPDPILSDDFRESLFSPDATVGVFYLARNFYAGISGEQLFQSLIKLNSSLDEYKLLRHYYINSGYQFYISDDYRLEPSILLKVSEQDVKGIADKLSSLKYQTDINIRLFYKDDYWGGLSYRTNGDIVAMGGVRYQNFYIGYSFDYTLSRIMNYSYGSHELSLGYRFGASESRFDWLDRY